MSISSSSRIITEHRSLIERLQNKKSQLSADRSKLSDKISAVRNLPENKAIIEKYRNLNNTYQDLDISTSDVKNKIKNKINELSNYKKNIDETSLKRKEIAEQLAGVSNFDGSEALRIKNGSYKLVNTSLFKNLLHRKRYADEAKCVISKFQTNKIHDIKESLGKKITVINSEYNHFENSIKNVEKDIKALSTELIKIKTEQDNHIDNNAETINTWLELNESKINPLASKITEIDKDIILLNKNIELSNEKIEAESKLIEAESKLIKKEQRKRVKEFCTIYQSNSGCKSMNETARAIFGNGGRITPIDHKAVYNEYYRCCEDQLRPQEWRAKKIELSCFCAGKIETVVKNIAEDIYQPSKNVMTTYRGQGITKTGFAEIKRALESASARNKRPIYNAGQFLSTAVNKELAESFSVAHKGKNETAIMFEIKGNSSTTMHADHDLQFNIGRDNEEIYSPLASFMVTKIVGNTIYLSECDRKEGGVSLPY